MPKEVDNPRHLPRIDERENSGNHDDELDLKSLSLSSSLSKSPRRPGSAILSCNSALRQRTRGGRGRQSPANCIQGISLLCNRGIQFALANASLLIEYGVHVRGCEVFRTLATDALCCGTAPSHLRVEPQYLDPRRFQSRLRLTTNL